MSVVGQFNDATHKTLNHQGHEVSRRLVVSGVSFVYLRGLCGSGFRKLTTIQQSGGVANA